MKRILAQFIVTFAMFALAPAARADVVSPPTESCEDGTEQMACHGSYYCRPVVCQTKADCQKDAECIERSFCAQTTTCYTGYPNHYEAETVAGTCSSASDCSNGAMCEPLKVCVSSGCGCRVGSSPGDFAGMMLAIGAVIGLAMRRGIHRRLESAAPSL